KNQSSIMNIRNYKYKLKRMIKMKKLNNVLNTVLEDDNTANGGVSFKGETLKNFLDETGISYSASMEEINNALIECGIKPSIDEKQEEIKVIESYKQAYKKTETEIKQLETQNKNLLAEIIKLQAKILSEK